MIYHIYICPCMQGNLLHHNDPFTLVVLFPMQVKKSGIEAVEIPEHEVVTRRKQFRMKKDKAQARLTKKEQKAKDAEEKKALKESKKADREAKKLEKEAKKKLEKEAKKSKKTCQVFFFEGWPKCRWKT